MGEFEEEVPTLECVTGCRSCSATAIRGCVPITPEKEAAWDEKTEPTVVPAFLQGYDDDYILDTELGGESG